MGDTVARELQRGWVLLGLADVPLDERDPNPSAEGVGAAAGFGFEVAGSAVQGSVYVFDRWGGGDDVGARLVDLVDGDGYDARYTVNGALLLVVVGSDAAAGETLDALVGAFAGLEM